MFNPDSHIPGEGAPAPRAGVGRRRTDERTEDRRHSMTVVRVAFTQATWTGDKESMIARH